MTFPPVVTCPHCEGRGFLTEKDRERMNEQDTLKSLREGPPPYCVCGACGRTSWDMAEVGRVCAKPAPAGKPCAGVMRPVQHRALRPPLSK